MEETCQFQASFTNDTANLALIRLFVREKAAEIGFGSDELDKIELAVDEACANVIEHAYPPEVAGAPKSQQLHLCLKLEFGKFTIIITDHGETFDPSVIQPADLTEYMAQYRVGGLGIYLMRSLMDQVDYHIEPGIKNEVRLVKYLIPENTPS